MEHGPTSDTPATQLSPEPKSGGPEPSAKRGGARRIVRRGRKPVGSRPAAWIVTTQNEVARFFGVSTEAIEQWRKASMPGRRGRWDLAKIAQWRLGKARRKEDPEDDDVHTSAMRAAKLKREQAAAELQRLKVEQVAGRLIDRDEVESGHLARTRYFVAVLERIPSELIPRVCGVALADAQAVAEAWITAQREGM